MTYTVGTDSIRMQACKMEFDGDMAEGTYYVDMHAMSLQDEAQPTIFVGGYIVNLTSMPNDASRFHAADFDIPIIGTRHGYHIAEHAQAFTCTFVLTALEPRARGSPGARLNISSRLSACLQEVTTNQAVALFSARQERVFGRLVSTCNELMAGTDETSVVLYGKHSDPAFYFVAICVMSSDPHIIVTETMCNRMTWTGLPDFVRLLYGTTTYLPLRFDYTSAEFGASLDKVYGHVDHHQGLATVREPV
jgi:hypothetical protein